MGAAAAGQGLGENRLKPQWAAAGTRLIPRASVQLTGLFVFPLCLGNAVLPRWKPVAQALLRASLRNNHLVSKEAKIQGKLKLRAWQACGGFAASPRLFA